jgi:uncharacterized membrane-anchored protein YhcB (DUF1043 family)
MNQKNSIPVTALITLLGGVTLGGLVVALTTNKSGKEFRSTLRAMGNRLLRRNGGADDTDDELIRAMFI